MRNLRVPSLMAAVGILGLTLIGLATSPATAKQSSSVVVVDASTEMALIGAGDLMVQSVLCGGKCIDDNGADCFASNCGVATPTCCCKWCNGALDCYPRNTLGSCIDR